MRRNNRIYGGDSRWMLRLVGIGAAVLIVCYGLFEARRLIAGPQITIDTPTAGSATSSSALTIAGTAHNVSFLTINDSPAYTDEAGHFALVVSPPAGYTVVTVTATDRFGRRASQSVALTVFNYCHV